MPSGVATSSAPAPRPSRPPPSSPTMRPCTSSWEKSTRARAAPPTPSRSCAALSGSTRCCPPPIVCAASRSSRWAASRRRSSSGSSGSASPPARKRRWRRPTWFARRGRRRRCSGGPGRPWGTRAMVDEVKALSAQLAQEPQSLVFLRLGELLRQRRQLDAAQRVALLGLEGAEEGLLLLDAAGLVLGGGLRSPTGDDVTEAVAAYLAGVSQEAARTAKLLGLGAWRGLSAEGRQGHVHLVPPTGDSLLLVLRDRSVPLGRLAIVAQRAAQAARHWLERQQ